MPLVNPTSVVRDVNPLLDQLIAQSSTYTQEATWAGSMGLLLNVPQDIAFQALADQALSAMTGEWTLPAGTGRPRLAAAIMGRYAFSLNLTLSAGVDAAVTITLVDDAGVTLTGTAYPVSAAPGAIFASSWQVSFPPFPKNTTTSNWNVKVSVRALAGVNVTAARLFISKIV